MKITLSPIRMDATLTASVKGDVLTLNGVAVDLSGVTAKEPLEEHAHDWIAGPVTRMKGELCLTLLLPHGLDAPSETLFPSPITAGDGPVILPPFDLNGRRA